MKKVIAVLVVAAIAAGAWYWLRPHPGGAAEDRAPVAQVQVAALRIQPIVDSLPAFGVIEPAPSGAHGVAVAYDAVVTSVAVSPGSRVAAGDIIMGIEATPDAELAVNSARSVSKLADQGLEATRQRYELKLATRQDLLAAEQAADDARLRLASLEGRGQSGDGRVVAPVAGIVTKLDLQPGAVVPAGTALVTVAGGGQLEAHLAVEAADAGRVGVGQVAVVSPADRPQAEGASGTVRLVGGSVDAVTGAVDVRVALPTGTGWFAGEHVRGAILVRQKAALVASRAAILPDNGQQVLYTVKDDKAVRHAVHVGITADNVVEVISSELHAGDMAVVVGNYELEDGMAVQVSPGEAKGAGGNAEEAKPNPGKTP